MTTQSPIDPRIAQEEAARGQAFLRAGKIRPRSKRSSRGLDGAG